MNKQDTVRAWCVSRIGCPYVYGATGQPCTVAYRQARAAQYPNYAAKIRRNCPQMNGTASTCKGCKWADPTTGQGRDAFDCAQLSRAAMEAVGIPMVSGANSQWERTKWAESGTINNLPREKVCLVFRWDTDHMGHVGVYLGDGTVTHAKGHDWGVVREKLADTAFTHWGQPDGLMTEGPIRPVLRYGASGPAVTLLQTLLCDVVTPIQVDGAFGPETRDAVRAFQQRVGLTVDGVVGPKTWAALETATGHEENDPDVWDPDASEIVTPPAVDMPGERLDDPDDAAAPDAPDGDVVPVSHQDWAAIKAAASVLYQAVKKYEGSD